MIERYMIPLCRLWLAVCAILLFSCQPLPVDAARTIQAIPPVASTAATAVLDAAFSAQAKAEEETLRIIDGFRRNVCAKEPEDRDAWYAKMERRGVMHDDERYCPEARGDL